MVMVTTVMTITGPTNEKLCTHFSTPKILGVIGAVAWVEIYFVNVENLAQIQSPPGIFILKTRTEPSCHVVIDCFLRRVISV